MNVAFSNGITCKYTPAEIKAISRDFDAVKSVKVGLAGITSYDLPGLVTYPLIAVLNIDIKKQSGVPVTLYLKNDIQKFS